MRKLQIHNHAAFAVSVRRGVNGRERFAGWRQALLLMVLFAAATSALSGPLTGTYKMTSVGESGADVHFSALLNLVNPGDVPVSLTGVGVHSLAAPGHVQFVRTNVVIEPHSSASTTVSFVIPKRDFELWSAASHQIFTVRRLSSGSDPTLENVALVQTKE